MLTLFLTLAPRAEAASVYVVPANTTPLAPYTNWVMAATNIQTAVDYASTNYPTYDTVTISNGSYKVTAEISITNGLTVIGFGGSTGTVVYASGNVRCFNISNANAVVDGFSITNGGLSGNGVGVYLQAGTVRNCRIAQNGLTVNGNANGYGVYMATANTLLSNCVVEGNGYFSTSGGNTKSGGGIYAAAASARISHCIIRGNCIYATAGNQGGGVYSGTLDNCLIVGNIARWNGGGAFGSVLINCTVVSNQVTDGNAATGGGTHSCTATNTIVYFNTSPAIGAPNYSGGTFNYSCTTPTNGLTGAGNTPYDPLFKNAAAGDFRLQPASPCVDTGSNVAWIVSGTDLDGSNRLVNALGKPAAFVDMGAYEKQETTFPLDVGILGSNLKGQTNLTVQFTAWAVGSTNGIYYWWDYDANGTFDEEGADKQSVSHPYTTPGLYSVVLKASNSLGEVAFRTNLNYVTVSPQTAYVVQSGSTPTLPYTNWATAATDIQTALDFCSSNSTVLVSNGTYTLAATIALADAITLQNAPGNTNVVINGNNAFRCLYVNHASAVVDGFTITNGYYNIGNPYTGEGVYLAAGTVRNCRIAQNGLGLSSGANASGYGVWMGANTLLSNCVVEGNGNFTAGAAGAKNGGGIYANAASARISHCIIRGNSILSSAANLALGGGVYGGTLDNCLIVGNSARWYGGGAYQSYLINCTVVSNVAWLTGSAAGGGTFNCMATNSIVYFNVSSNTGPNYSGGTFAYSCTTPDPGGTNNTVSDPLFVNNAGDYHLQGASPAVDAGTNLAWITNGTDLDGSNRLSNGKGILPLPVVDMGAYERPAGTLPLALSFSQTPQKGLVPLTVQFTASPVGSTNGIYYWWDYDANGTFDEEGADKQSVSQPYTTPGLYSVVLKATNSAGEVAFKTNLNGVTVSPLTAYVVQSGSTPTPPYTNWATAANNIQTALDFCSSNSTVLVSNGTYTLASAINLTDAITLQSAPDNTNVFINGNNTVRGLFVSNANAVVDGFTITNGYYSVGDTVLGAGVYLAAGTVRNCRIAQNGLGIGAANVNGFGVWMEANTLLSNCVVEGNGYFGASGGSTQNGGGIYAHAPSARISHCIIRGNGLGINITAGNQGGGVYSGTLDNCLIVGNIARWNGGGACGSVLVNCTVVSNVVTDVTAANGGGTYNCTTTNSIVYFNVSSYTNANWGPTTATNISYSCTTPTNGLTGPGNIQDDPLFVDLAAGKYWLKTSSTCIDKGTNLNWLVTGTDLAGQPRKQNKGVDMGAYEILVPPAGTMLSCW